MAFKIAGSMAFRQAVVKLHWSLLEPMMKVEITTPDEYLGDVMEMFHQEEGRIQGMNLKWCSCA